MKGVFSPPFVPGPDSINRCQLPPPPSHPRVQARQHRSQAKHCTQCQGQTLSVDLGAVCWPLGTKANTAFSFAEELFSFFFF